MNIHKKERSKIKQQYIAHYNYEKHTAECYKSVYKYSGEIIFIHCENIKKMCIN